MAIPFISLRNATFRLGERLVFQNTSLDFNRDEQWAVIGANGAGKSLFGDALRERLPIVQGELRYHFSAPRGLSHGECIGHVSFEDRKASVHDTVVQSRWNSFEEDGALTVREFLSYERVMDVNPYEISAEHATAKLGFQRRFRRAITTLKAQPFLDRTLLSLSNGETQRIQLARALCVPLRLLILDEPFNGLDVEAREYFGAVLKRLMQTSLRVLFITARIENIPGRISHLVCVNHCEVVAAGPRREVLSRRDVQELFKPGNKGMFLQKPRAFRKRRVKQRSFEAELVRLRKVTVRYGSATILNSINWTVCSGESWALLGPNGSGKTTLLSLILGDNPQAYMNDVTVFGQKRGCGESIWDIKKQIGWVSPELHVHFDDSVTCLQVVESGFHDSIGLFEAVTPHQGTVARRWLKEFRLLEFANEPLFALSPGLQRMVLLARALVKAPRLLVLDEPCQGLDDAHRDFFVKELDALLRSRSMTAIYVTHRPEEIPRSIKHVLKLATRGGKAVIQSRTR